MKVGDKVKGFKFKSGTNDIAYIKEMIQYEGEEGKILRFGKSSNIIVEFKDGKHWSYPIMQNKPTKDSIVESVINQFKQRSEAGINKYGTTLDRNDLSTLEWIEHAKQEAMDFILYLEKLKQELK